MSTELEINDWQHFSSIAEQLDVAAMGSVSYAFRGHANKEWKLNPTLLRNLNLENKTIDDVLEIEKRSLAEFKSQAHLHINPNELSLTKDTVSWWTAMQHYGAPTRLLDWTKSIYVATYFAVTEHLEEDGSVWVVHVGSLHEKMNSLHGSNTMPKTQTEIDANYFSNDAPELLIFCNRSSLSERMIAQQGIFSISRNVLSNHEEVLGQVLESEPNIVQYKKLIISAHLKPLFAKRLRSMNITAGSLFPGLDGLGKYVKEYVQLS